MKLEPGKYYRTRNGRKAYVAAVENPLCPDAHYPVVGYIDGAYECWTREGMAFIGSPSEDDLVAPWTEPLDHYRNGRNVLLVCGDDIKRHVLHVCERGVFSLYR